MTSIVILSYNTLAYLQYCIESIRRFTSNGSYELIVVENASTDGSAEWLREQTDIRTIFNTCNAGFPKGCNQGMAVAEGEDILLLNSDTIVTPHWLENLKKALYSREQVGAVGCITNSCSNLQSIAVPYQSIDDMLDFAAKFNQSNQKLWERRLRLIGFCLLVKREVYQKIGGLDERFSPGNFEDDDYSLRIWQAGYELLLCRDTFIHHFGSASFQKDENPEIAQKKRESFRELSARNRQKFLEKWQVPPNYQELGLQDVFPDWAGGKVVSCRELLDFAQRKTHISAIVAVCGNLTETKNCLEILHCLLAAYPHEIIVIDNCADTATTAYLSAQDYLRVIGGMENQGIAAAWNQGAEAARGDVLVFLHSDVILSPHSIDRMLDVLIHQQAGAVGPYLSHSRYYQQALPYKDYQTYEEFWHTAEILERSLEIWEGCLLLESACLMMKKKIYQQIGRFDEQFRLPGWEAVDYSIRLQMKGELLYKAAAFVHCGRGDSHEKTLPSGEACDEEKKLFLDKWQLDPGYFGLRRQEMLDLVNTHKQGLSVLELGCAMGANLQWLRAQNPSVRGVGVELNSAAAAVAQNFGDIYQQDVEQLDFSKWAGQFDYVLAGDILEHLQNPWQMSEKIRNVLKPGGMLIVSLPNVLYWDNVLNLMRGEWQYEDSGILDRTHLRFFTKKSVETMLTEAGFTIEHMVEVVLAMSEDDKQRVSDILNIWRSSGIPMADEEQFMAYQWVVVAKN